MLKINWKDENQSVISYDLTELQNKLTDSVFYDKLTVKEAAKKFNEKESNVKKAYIDILSALYGEGAKSIVEANF